jgi:hypothetical protein
MGLVNLAIFYNYNNQPSLLVPSKLGYARDETHMS